MKHRLLSLLVSILAFTLFCHMFTSKLPGALTLHLFLHLITLTWSIFFLPLFYPPKPNPLAHSPSELRSYAPLVDSSLRDANRSVLPLNSEIYLRCRSSRLPSSQVLDSTVGRSLASLLVLAGSPLCCFLHPTTSGFFREIQSCDAISQRWQALLQD